MTIELKARGAIARHRMKEDAQRVEREQAQAQARQDEQQRQAQQARNAEAAMELTARFIEEAENQTTTIGANMSDEFEIQEYDKLLKQHAEQIGQEIETIKATPETIRRERQLTAELQTLAAELAPLQKFPSRHRARINELMLQVEEKSKSLEQLSAKEQPKDWRTQGNHVFTVFAGGRVVK